MEILATNVSYAGGVFFGILFSAVLIYALWGVFAKDSEIPIRILSVCLAAVALFGVIKVVDSPSVTTYDAIITDWNEVYEQGYEVIETNGQIVTLRKVDE